MKKYAVFLLSVVLIGCSGLISQPTNQITSERSDVFREIAKDSSLPSGSVMLTVKAEIKTHHKDFYILESRKSPHGKQQYPIMINIDGQQASWEMPGVRDDTSMYNDRGAVIPEGGRGMKYTLEKKISLTPGRHQIAVTLPGDDYVKKLEISLPLDRPSLLEFRPVYKQSGIGHHQNFLHGIENFEVFLNGHEVQ
jgi:hypothetical protein